MTASHGILAPVLGYTETHGRFDAIPAERFAEAVEQAIKACKYPGALRYGVRTALR
jgi:hypothetical protein